MSSTTVRQLMRGPPPQLPPHSYPARLTYSPGNLTLTPPLTYHGLGDTTVAVGGDDAHTSKRLVRRQQETFGPPRRLALNTGRFGVANCSRYGVSQFFGV